MNWAAFLLSMVAPIVVRAIIAIGFSTVTLVGVTDLVSGMVSMAQSNWAALPANVLGLCALSGIPQALGAVFGAYLARVAMATALGALKRFVLK